MNRELLATQAAILLVLQIISKLLGLLREQVVAASFGATTASDALMISLTVPLMLEASLSGSLGKAFLPIFTALTAKGDIRKAWDLAGSVLGTVLSVVSGAVLLGIVLAPVVLSWLGAGLPTTTREVALHAQYLTLPAILFTVPAVVLKYVINAREEFIVPAVAPLLQNLCTIAGTFLLGRHFGILGFSVGLLVGAAVQFSVMVPGSFGQGLRWQMVRPRWSDPDVRHVWLLALPILIGYLLKDLYIPLERSLGSAMSAGSVAALAFAGKLRDLPLGMFSGTINTVLFPSLSRYASHQNQAGLRDLTITGLRMTMALTLPTAAMMTFLAVPIVRVLFEHGAFDADATALTVAALWYYMPGMVGVATASVLDTTLYAMSDTVRPISIYVLGSLVTMVADLLLAPVMGYTGLAAGNSIGSITAMLVMFFAVFSRIGTAGLSRFFRGLLEIIVATGVMGAAVFVFAHLTGLNGVKVELALGKLIGLTALAVVTGGLIYLGMLLLFRNEELVLLAGYLRSKFAGPKRQ